MVEGMLRFVMNTRTRRRATKPVMQLVAAAPYFAVAQAGCYKGLQMTDLKSRKLDGN